VLLLLLLYTDTTDQQALQLVIAIRHVTATLLHGIAPTHCLDSKRTS